jgi:hypothetical protein
MFKSFQKKDYEEVCNIGFKNFNKYKLDDEYLSLYGLGCLYSDHIDRVAIPSILLKNTKEARANAAYFSTILMQKKLLYYSLVDGYDISNIKIPTTDLVLSKVFELYRKSKKNKQQTFYTFQDPKSKNVTYRLYLEKIDNKLKIIIEEYNNNILIKKHIYW